MFLRRDERFRVRNLELGTEDLEVVSHLICVDETKMHNEIRWNALVEKPGTGNGMEWNRCVEAALICR